MGGVSSELAHGAVSVEDTATLVRGAKTVRKSLTVRNVDATNSVWIGGSTVADTDGFPVKAGEAYRLDDFNGPLYAVAGSGNTVGVRFVEIGG